ncbi:MAG: GNAT family N-acetyltransferase [Methanomicrobiaceae archaeon]|nr:GNAT family N-acetyltransferase [Methanomicrobiaceae archaeon]
MKEDALDNQLRNFSVTHLAYWNHNLVGYFTLVNDCISVDNLNPEDRYDDIIYRRYPALKIARIATDTNYEKKGIGSLMIDEIFYIAFEVSKRAGCRLLTVDAKKNAVGFYINCGFKQSNSSHKDTSSMYMEFHNALHQR